MSIEHQKEILNKIKHKEPLSKNELYDVIFQYDIYTKEGSDSRWYRNISTISKLDDTYVITNWKQGLTDSQENEYDEDPIIVTKVKTEEVKMYRHTFYLDGNTIFIVTNNNLEFMKK